MSIFVMVECDECGEEIHFPLMPPEQIQNELENRHWEAYAAWNDSDCPATCPACQENE